VPRENAEATRRIPSCFCRILPVSYREDKGRVQAEYIALTQLQADAFVTLDEDLARTVGDLVETASINALS
jgi:hypothetical protein